eukprot:1059169-Rhodomonas_salina.1
MAEPQGGQTLRGGGPRGEGLRGEFARQLQRGVQQGEFSNFTTAHCSLEVGVGQPPCASEAQV